MDIERLMLKSRGLAINDSEAQPDMGRLRAYRLGRIQAEVRARDLGGLLLFDSVNIRYASGTSNAQIFNFHTPSRALFVPPDVDAEELMRCYTSVPSAIASASSTSTPRYRTVLSIFVCPSRICTARRLPVCL